MKLRTFILQTSSPKLEEVFGKTNAVRDMFADFAEEFQQLGIEEVFHSDSFVEIIGEQDMATI